jgi:hypothetical protein
MQGLAGSQSWDMRRAGKTRRLAAAAGFANDQLVSVTRIVRAGGLDRQTAAPEGRPARREPAHPGSRAPVASASLQLIGQAASGVALFLTGLILSAQPFRLVSSASCSG